MTGKKIVIGICGIGRGHSIRQLPVVENLSNDNQVVVFAFGESYDFYESAYGKHPNVRVIKVVVPWLVGGLRGIDFKKTATIVANDTSQYFKINMLAYQAAYDYFGRPDLVITDYEPTAAQLAYCFDVPLLSLDQQSKYLHGDFPILSNMSALSERVRLNMFIPRADKRLACSFFKTPEMAGGPVRIVPPVIKKSVVALRNNPDRKTDDKLILVYLSPYSRLVQLEQEILEIFSEYSTYEFRLYVSRNTDYMKSNGYYQNIKIYYHGDASFDSTSEVAGSAISTAGHTFLSESMYLARPVFTIPLETYEQAYNAQVIADYDFGATSSKLTSANLKIFLDNIEQYRKNIENDETILLREDGLPKVLQTIRKMLA